MGQVFEENKNGRPARGRQEMRFYLFIFRRIYNSTICNQIQICRRIQGLHDSMTVRKKSKDDDLYSFVKQTFLCYFLDPTRYKMSLRNLTNIFGDFNARLVILAAFSSSALLLKRVTQDTQENTLL